MNFYEHLLKSYSNEFVTNLSHSLTQKRTYGGFLNVDKITMDKFNKDFPNLKTHPFIKNAFIYDKNEYDLGKTFYHDAGAIYLSDPASLMVANFLNPTENDIVLDMCAAPGGKTLQSSILMKNKGVIIANDLSYARALVLSQNVERLGRKNIIVTSNNLSKIYENYRDFFTKIILDAPCSGSGMFRKDPKMLLDWSIEKVYRQVQIQKELIELAYQMLAPGGVLSYSTCSYSKEENYQIIRGLLENHVDMKIIPLDKLQSISLTPIEEGITLSPVTFEGEGQYFCLLKKDGNLKVKNIFSDNLTTDFSFLNCSFKGNLKKQNNELYLSPININLKSFNIIRDGLKIGKYTKNVFIPDHHLSHFLSSESSISLNPKQLSCYLKGETLSIQHSPGYYPVSYRNINIGFGKICNDILKNHYPKGLRHN